MRHRTPGDAIVRGADQVPTGHHQDHTRARAGHRAVHRALGKGRLGSGGRECDAAIARHQHRDRPAELRHAGGDPGDLVRAMGLGVARIGAQAVERPGLDRFGGEAEGHDVR